MNRQETKELDVADGATTGFWSAMTWHRLSSGRLVARGH